MGGPSTRINDTDLELSQIQGVDNTKAGPSTQNNDSDTEQIQDNRDR